MISKFNSRKRENKVKLDYIPAKIQLTLICTECLEIRMNIHYLTDKELNLLSHLNLKYPDSNTGIKYTLKNKEFNLDCRELFEYLNYKFFGPRIDAIKEVLGYKQYKLFKSK